MKNIDKMKNSIIEQIKKMDLEEFFDLNYVVLGEEGVPDGLLDTTGFFNCKLCQKISHCGCSERETLDNVDINECVEKYKKYMLAETER